MGPKNPVWYLANRIKEVLGLDRTMTAPGSDVIDAVNKQSDQIVNLGPINNLTSDSTTAALSAAQGQILNNKLFAATDTGYGASSLTDTWLLTAKNGAYRVSGGSTTGTIIEGADNIYGILLVFSSFKNDVTPTTEEYGIIFFANAANSLYYRNFYRKKSTNTITWRGALKKVTAS